MDHQAGDPWARARLDPRLPEHAGVRASDEDRDVVHGILGEAYADGRITREELDERAAAVPSLRYLGDLPRAVADLLPGQLLRPGPPALPVEAFEQRAHDVWRRRRREAVWSFLSASLICWVIWLATMGGGFPWPLFVMLGTGLNAGRIAFQREQITTEERRRLERRAERRVRRGLPPLPE